MSLSLEQEFSIVRIIEEYTTWLVSEGYLIKLDNGKMKRSEKPWPEDIEEQYKRSQEQ